MNSATVDRRIYQYRGLLTSFALPIPKRGAVRSEFVDEQRCFEIVRVDEEVNFRDDACRASLYNTMS